MHEHPRSLFPTCLTLFLNFYIYILDRVWKFGHLFAMIFASAATRSEVMPEGTAAGVSGQHSRLPPARPV
jgi:hypothetical protein